MDTEKYNRLILDLLFGKNKTYKIEVMEYIKNIYRSDDFIADTKIILKRGKVQLVKERIVVGMDSVIWEISIKR